VKKLDNIQIHQSGYIEIWPKFSRQTPVG